MTALSLVAGPTHPPLLEHTIGEALAMAAERWPDGEALVSAHQGVRLTWRELAAEADALAAAFLDLGLLPGDRVGTFAPNCAEWALAQFATARAGLIQVNINPAYRTSELEYTLKKVGVRALVSAAAFKGSDYLSMVDSLDLPMLEHKVVIGSSQRQGWIPFDSLAASATASGAKRLAEVAESLSAHQAINIQFTSGTTGLPKGATLSHRNILNNAYFVGLGLELTPQDRLCIPVPLYHCFGMVMGNLACLVHGSTMVYPGEAFDPLLVLKTLQTERCTALYGVPTMFIAELDHPEFASFDLSSLRTGLMAGSPCPVEVMKKVIEKMHMTGVGIAYGMTETSPVSFQSASDDPIERRVSTIGRAQPHLQVKAIGAEGQIVPRGEPGELCTRGYSVMLGYWDDAEQTARAIDAEGWMHTGDLGTIDAEGYGNIVGRLKDMVIRGGENVYPREVEEFLYQHPKVADVQVVGVPDLRYGEEICAWIRLKDGQSASEDEIREACRGKIAHYKIPRYVRFVDAFPMTVTGKVQKFEIRKAMIAELGLAEAATA